MQGGGNGARMTSPGLLILATAPVLETPAGLRLDVKFVDGMRLHGAQWPGPVRCVLRRGAGAVPFGADYAAEDLGFDLRLLDADAPLGADLFDGIACVMAAADDAQALGLVGPARAAGAAVIYSLEYTLATRMQIAWLDRGRSLPRRLRSMLWQWQQERRRLPALRAADGVQFNGYPAWDRYRSLNANALLYLDGRMTPDMMASPGQMADQAARLRSGAPLRLIHSGRLEAMKGAQDLLPVISALDAAGVPVTLDIFGTGALEGDIRAGLAAFGGRVRLHAPVDFASELVPFSRANADLFLSCHRQGDPSCTYIEAMGCGLAVAGYANAMWARMAAESGGGVVAPLGKPAALAAAIAAWHQDREGLIQTRARALDFARAHDFPTEFSARMAHARGIAGV